MSEIIQDRSIDLVSVGGLVFTESDHSYVNDKGVKYTGTTTLLGRYHSHFDADMVSTNKSIKDCVIQYFGKMEFDTIKDKVGFENIVTTIHNNLKDYEYLPIINKLIKEIVIEKVGEDKYLELEKMVHGFDNLYIKLKAIKNKFIELEDRIIEQSAIVKYGTMKYKAFVKQVDGFDQLYTIFDNFNLKTPELYDTMTKHKAYLLDDWTKTNLRAITEGTIEHDKREQEIYTNGGYEYKGVWYEYIKDKNIMTVTNDDVCIIPECMVWNHDMKICGLADIFLFNKGVISVLDYKTNESIDIKHKINIPKYQTSMLGVCSSLPDLNYYHYSLQLKIYQMMAILLRPEFTMGENIIIHTTSETHYRYEDKIHECYEVQSIVDDIFLELKN